MYFGVVAAERDIEKAVEQRAPCTEWPRDNHSKENFTYKLILLLGVRKYELIVYTYGNPLMIKDGVSAFSVGN